MKTGTFHVTAVVMGLTLLGVVAIASTSLAAEGTAIFVMRSDGSEVREVVRAPSYLEHSAPRFSHDGKRLVFAVARDTTSSKRSRKFYVVNVDGTGLEAVNVDMMPDWSPDDKQLVFHRNPRGGEASTVHVQNIDGAGRTQLAEGKSPRWSPNGTALAIRDEQMLRAWNLADDETADLFDAPVEQVHSGYTWSPDGKQIAVSVTPAAGAQNQLLIVNTQGTEPRVKVRLEGKIGGVVCWSPDAKRILYERGERLIILDTDGEGAGQEIAGQQGRTFHGDWSPDGKWIAFASDRD